MAYYTDLKEGVRKEITEDSFSSDPSMDAAWQTSLERQPEFHIAVSEHLSNIGQLPISIKEKVESNPQLQDSSI